MYYYPDGEAIQRAAWFQLSIRIAGLTPNRRADQPIGSGSASLSKQREGKVYSPRAMKGYTPIHYFEPMLEPPGLLRHAAVPIDGGTYEVECDAPVFVAMINDRIRVGSFYYSSIKLAAVTESDMEGEDCLLEGGKITCEREWRFLGLMPGKGTFLVPAILDVWATALDEVLSQPAGIALTGIGIP